MIVANSSGSPEVGTRISDLREEWSDAARTASAAARKGRGQGVAVRSKLAKAAYRKAGGTGASGGAKMKAPDVSNTHLNSNERPIDYGHVGELLREKYGASRGRKMYTKLIDNPSSDKGLYFVIGTKIQKEKRAMLDALGPSYSKLRNLDTHNYRTLHSAWLKSVKSPTKMGHVLDSVTRGLVNQAHRRPRSDRGLGHLRYKAGPFKGLPRS